MANVATIRLLNEARAAGLKLLIERGQLVVRGPRCAEAVAKKLLAQKTEVIAAIRPTVIPPPLPIDVVEQCFNEGCSALLEFKQGRALCPRCGVHQRIVS